MTTKYLITVVLIAAVLSTIIMGGVLARTSALAQDTEPDEAVAVPTESKPAPAVVSAIPYETVTEYQMDPFEPGRVRSTATKTSTLILVRADGSTEIVNAK